MLECMNITASIEIVDLAKHNAQCWLHEQPDSFVIILNICHNFYRFYSCGR